MKDQTPMTTGRNGSFECGPREKVMNTLWTGTAENADVSTLFCTSALTSSYLGLSVMTMPVIVTETHE